MRTKKKQKTDDHIGVGGAIVSTFVPLGNFGYYFAQKDDYPDAAQSALHLGIVGTVFWLALFAAARA